MQKHKSQKWKNIYLKWNHEKIFFHNICTYTKLSNEMHQKSQSSINEKKWKTKVSIGKNNICDVNVLIGAIGAPLRDCILRINF
jgi:hypothetical protein